MLSFNKFKNTARQFYCLRGFVAVIFSILFIRSAYMCLCFPGFWNILSTILLGIFAYWWVSSILKYGHRCYTPINFELLLPLG